MSSQGQSPQIPLPSGTSVLNEDFLLLFIIVLEVSSPDLFCWGGPSPPPPPPQTVFWGGVESDTGWTTTNQVVFPVLLSEACMLRENTKG